MHHVPHALMFLIGTKSDLKYDKDILMRLQEKKLVPITSEEGELLAKKHGCFLYHETSARTGEGLGPEFSKMLIQSTVVFTSVNEMREKKKCMIC
jgi:GTPase SAR1 family protein